MYQCLDVDKKSLTNTKARTTQERVGVKVISSYWRKPDHTFNPHDYTGFCREDNYTKRPVYGVETGLQCLRKTGLTIWGNRTTESINAHHQRKGTTYDQLPRLVSLWLFLRQIIFQGGCLIITENQQGE